MELLLYIVFFSLLGGALSACIAFMLAKNDTRAHDVTVYLISFAAGTMLATVFFDLLPEASALSEAQGHSAENFFITVFVGLLFAFFIEGVIFQFLHSHHGVHDTETHHQDAISSATPWVISFGDSLHNFVDGVAIASAFFVNIPTGIVTTFAIAAHEIPQEIGDFTLMLRGGWSKQRALLLNLASALLSTLGAVLAWYFQSMIEPFVGWVLAFAAGLFIYIATSDLMPEILHLSRQEKLKKIIPPFVGGIAIIYTLVSFIPA
jgi:zinc and cadmium transporter